MNAPKVNPLFYKYGELYYRFIEVERFWSPAAGQQLYTFRGTSYMEINGKLYVENNVSVTLSEKDREQKMKMATRDTVMRFIGKLV